MANKPERETLRARLFIALLLFVFFVCILGGGKILQISQNKNT